jgi:ferrochelatase
MARRVTRVAVVLFNLGGPDRLASVRPFLRNLFSDPAILRVPGFVRFLLARLIATLRAPTARRIYGELGGGSPILANTESQARALEQRLSEMLPASTVQSFVAMRYWHPFARETARAVNGFAPQQVVLLPLYPQFSTTTTASSMRDWHRAAVLAGLAAPAHAICCYPVQVGFLRALATLVRSALAAWQGPPPRVLFSAHGLPEKIVAAGDPYRWQVEQTAASLAAELAGAIGDWVVCYQSRVGPLKWIGPSTADEIRRAGRDRVALLVVPIAFVSEHSETLVELDIEYRRLADEVGVTRYQRVATVSSADEFIRGLAELVCEALARAPGLASAGGTRICPASFPGCAQSARSRSP